MKIKQLMDFPEYAEAKARHDRAQEALASAEAAYGEILAEENESAATTADARARAFLKDGEIPESAAAVSQADRLAAMSDRKRVLEQALRIAREDLESITQAVSRQILAECEPQYRALMADIVQAMADLADLETRRLDFVSQCEQEGLIGLTAYLPVIAPSSLGRLDDETSRVRMILDDAKRQGISTKAPGRRAA